MCSLKIHEVKILTITLGVRNEEEEIDKLGGLDDSLFGNCPKFPILRAEDPGDIDRNRQRLVDIFERDQTHLAVFIVPTWAVVKSGWFSSFAAEIKNLTAKRKKEIYVYRLIMDETLLSDSYDSFHISVTEIFASRALDAIYLYYKPGATGAAVRRLHEFISRILGCDLPSGSFPNYSPAELQKIAHHINLENFNFGQQRRRAISKYEIGRNGRPVFVL